MAKVLIAAALIAAVATPAQASEQRETQLLKAMPIKAQIKHENKHDWLVRVHERRQARREAAQQAVAAAVVAPEPSTAPPATTYTSGSWADELAAVGFPSSAIPTMLYIIDRESGGCPTAVYGHGCDGAGYFVEGGPACGLIQAYPCPGPEAMDPMTNLAIGYAKYRASGFAPWGM